MSAGELERYVGTDISVSIKGDRTIFVGVCEDIVLTNQASYKTVQITAYTASIKMDREAKKVTFQNPSKTLKQLAEHIGGLYGIDIVPDRDCPIPEALYQQNETDFQFLKRVAASKGKVLFVDAVSALPQIHMGKPQFRSFGAEVLGESLGVSRDVSEMARTEAAGQNAEGYMFDTYACYCTTPQAGAGDIIEGVKVIKSGNLRLNKGVLENRITYAYEEGIHPAREEVETPALTKGVLTGKVNAVNGNQIQVLLDTDGGMGDMVWVTYESSISKNFYCMPDEGDSVFLYFENNGNVVCLGSKHVNTDSPDFDNPKENVLTNHNKMIKLGEKKVTLSATRDLTDGGDPNEVSITMEEGVGITIQSGRDIVMETSENMNLFTGNVEECAKDYEAGKAKLEARHKQNAAIYSAESGTPSLESYVKDVFSSTLETQGKKTLDMLKGMVMYDLWAGLFTDDENPSASTGDVERLETGVATLYGYERVVLQVDQNVITLDTEINISAGTFKWLGYDQKSHSPEEKPLQDWWETILDGAQFLLDIAGCIPVLGAVPDLINAGISLLRGNFAEAAMSAVAAIPLAGDAVGAVKIAGKGAMLVSKTLTKAERVMSVLQGLYVSAQAAFALYQMKDGLADMYERWKNGENIFANPADVSMLFNLAGSSMMAARGMKGMGEGLTGKKLEIEYSGDPTKMNGNKNRKTTGCGDPINVVTGSFELSYTDFQMRDVRETFFLKRIYESVYENKGMLLGNRWFLNIESRLQRDKGNVCVQLPDMKIIDFAQTEYGWENTRNHNRIWQLYSMTEGFLLKNRQEERTYRYDTEGRLLSISDRFGNRISLSYEEGCLSHITTACGQILSFSYENGKLKTITAEDGRSLSYEYEGELLTRVTLANQSSICYEYDQNGNIHSITDQNENTYVTNEYDRRGRVVRQSTAIGGEYVLFYDERNRRTTFTDTTTGEQTVYEYDRKQNVVRTVYQDGTWEAFGYDDWENLVYERDRNSNETHKTYDIYGNLTEERLPSGLVTTNEYDVHNRRVHQYDNAGREVTWTYDERGCLTGEALLIAPGTWSSMHFEYDQEGRIIREGNPNGNVTEYVYDRFSEPVRITYPEGETTRFEYDMAGRCLRERNERGDVEYSYNRTDCLTQVRDRGGNIFRFRYDFLGNRTGILKPEQDDYIQISYDKLDNICEVITAQGNVYSYQNGTDGRLLKSVHPNAYDAGIDDGAGLTFDYDETGRRIRVHYPDGGCERYFLDGNSNIIKRVAPQQYEEQNDDGAGYIYEYDSADRLVKVTDAMGIVQQVYIYNLMNNVVKSIDARGYLTADNDEERIGTLYTYNLAGWMTSKREPLYQGADGQVHYKLTCFAYDAMGNRTEEKRYLEEQTTDSCCGRVHVISYTYDRSNRLIQVSDSTGAAICYSYDKTGYLTGERVRIDEEKWKEIRYEYSPTGRLTKHKVRLMEDTNQVPSLGMLSRVRESNWAVTEYTYDKNGNLIKVKMPEGGCYYYEYDRDDRLVRERHVEEGGEIANEIRYTYDAAGNQTSVTDVYGNTYEYEYDLRDRNVSILLPNGGRSRNEYDKNSNLICRYTPMQVADGVQGISKCWKYVYDSNNRVTQVISPEGTLLSSFVYAPDGQLSSVTDAVGSGVCLTYDLSGRRIHAETSNGSSQGYRYDAGGNIIGLTDGLANTTEFLLDSWGRITGVRKPDGSTEKYAYDYVGNVLRAQDGEGNTVLFRYDLNGNMTTRIDQLGAHETFGYDKENRMVSMTDRNGTHTRISYNMYGSIINRIATTADQSSTVTESYGYYPDGRLRYALGGGMRYDYTYDVMGRLHKKSASGRTLLTNEYDLNGNRTAMTDLTGKRTEYHYNSLDQLEEVVDNGKVQVRYTYNADGTIKRMEVGNGLITEYTYDTDKNIISQKTILVGMDSLSGGSILSGMGSLSASMEQSLAGSVPSILAMNHRDRNKPLTLVNNTYTYDTNGNRTSKQTLAGLTAYHYDATQRLVKVDYPTTSEEYHYDRAGNRTQKLLNGLVTEQYRYDARNRMVSKDILSLRADGVIVAECEEFTYDQQGNMLSDGRRNFAYDAMNRLSQVTTKEGNVQKDYYDGEGLRAEMEENGILVQFLFDKDKVVAETDCDQNTIRYIRGYELISSDSEKARTYYHYASDEMGSITHVIDAAGNVCNHYEYDAFGDFTLKEETIQNRFSYTGEQYDPITGLYYLRARFYNPVIGRFIQEDTYYGDGLNLYAYCTNNPVRYVDPSGHVKLPCPEKEESVNKLKAVGLSDEQCDLLYNELRKDYDEKGTLNKINKTLEEMESKHGKGIFEGTDARIGNRKISQAEYRTLREKTPSNAIQNMINKSIEKIKQKIYSKD